jgi:uncharacterized protein (DUF4415 family)
LGSDVGAQRPSRISRSIRFLLKKKRWYSSIKELLNFSILIVLKMRKEYDFAKMGCRKNPYAKKLKNQVTLCLEVNVIDYFRGLAAETGILYQNLINLYLRDCAHSNKRLTFKWAS